MKFTLVDKILGHKQNYLADVAGCHFTNFSVKMNGHMAFSDEQVHRLATYFNVSDTEFRRAIKEVRAIKRQKTVT